MRALVRVACERGIRAVSVAEVVAAAGVSRRTFYELFPDCEACALAAFDDSVERIAARVEPAYESRRRWQDRIRAALVALLEFLDEDPGVGQFVFVEALGAGPKALERRSSVLQALAAVVAAGQAAAPEGSPPPRLAAESVVGAVCAVLHERLLIPEQVSFVRLANPLMSLVVLPFLGPEASREELDRPVLRSRPTRAKTDAGEHDSELIKQLGMRITYRTVRMLLAIGDNPGASNRRLAEIAGIADQGQVSKLLSRLQKLGLVENRGGARHGAPNAWGLTALGEALAQTVGAAPS